MRKKRLYVYNPHKAPVWFGSIPFPPENYAVIPEDKAALLKAAKIPVLLETDAGFPPLWRHYGGNPDGSDR